MSRRTQLLSLFLSVAGAAAIFGGAQLELITLRPVYEGPMQSVQAGMGTRIGHEEHSLLMLTGVGVFGVLLGARRRTAALLSPAVGAVVLAFTVNAVWGLAGEYDLYTGVALFDGATGAVMLGGAVPLFVLGGLSLVVAGIVGFQTTSPSSKSSVRAGQLT